MKQFWKDYWELCKETGHFYKKHWKGVVVLNVVVAGAELAYFAYQNKRFERMISDSYKEEETQ